MEHDVKLDTPGFMYSAPQVPSLIIGLKSVNGACIKNGFNTEITIQITEILKLVGRNNILCP